MCDRVFETKVTGCLMSGFLRQKLLALCDRIFELKVTGSVRPGF
jgi:hypothetical protein